MKISKISIQNYKNRDEESPVMAVKNLFLKTFFFIFFFSSLFILNSCAIFIGHDHDGRGHDKHNEENRHQKHQEHKEHNEYNEHDH